MLFMAKILRMSYRSSMNISFKSLTKVLNFNVSLCCRKSLNFLSLNTTLLDFHYSCREELSCSNLQKFLSSK